MTQSTKISAPKTKTQSGAKDQKLSSLQPYSWHDFQYTPDCAFIFRIAYEANYLHGLNYHHKQQGKQMESFPNIWTGNLPRITSNKGCRIKHVQLFILHFRYFLLVPKNFFLPYRKNRNCIFSNETRFKSEPFMYLFNTLNKYLIKKNTWKKLFLSNFLKTLPFSSTKLLLIMMVKRALNGDT